LRFSSTLKKYILIIFSAIPIFIFLDCDEKEKVERVTPVEIKDTLKPELEIHYYYYKVDGLTTLTKLEEEFGSERKKIILALNRLDSRNLSKGDSLVIPDTVFNDIMPYSPFPEKISFIDSIPKMLIFSYTIQAFAAYEYGKLIRWGPTSMGNSRTPTPAGLFHTNWKAKVTVSTVDSTWILPWAFNLDNFDGVSMHQFDLPGYPASHACARLLEDDAKWIYDWAEQWILTKDQSTILAYGTPVIIYGEYKFKKKPLWKYLVINPDTTDVSKTELDSVINKYLPVIENRVAVRDSVIAAREKEKAVLSN